MKKLILQIITIIILVPFSINMQSSGGGPVRSWVANASADEGRISATVTSAENTLDITTFSLPEHLGEIRDIHHGNLDRLVVVIQDAHANYSAQRTIAEIIGYLNMEYGIRHINLEGGEGEYDLSQLTAIANDYVRESTANYFLKEGSLNGAEFAAVKDPGRYILWGVEDTDLYLENLKIYRDILPYQDRIEKIIDYINRTLNKVKVSIFTDRLLDLDRLFVSYKKGNCNFQEYIEKLMIHAENAGVDISGYENISIVRATILMEKDIDFRRANVQRDEIVDLLGKRLSNSEILDLKNATLRFRTGEVSRKAFYSYLLEKMKNAGIDKSRYRSFANYVQYISLYSELSVSILMEEMKNLLLSIRDKLARNETEKELLDLSFNLLLLENMFALNLIKEDYVDYRNNRDDYKIMRFRTFFEKMISKGVLKTSIPAGMEEIDTFRVRMEGFFEYSFIRDKVFVKNIRFGEEEKGACILLAGGFHTTNLCALFKEKDISYVTILPKFTSPENYESPYFAKLSGQGTPMAKVIFPAASMLALYTHLTGTSNRVHSQEDLEAWRWTVEVVRAFFAGEEIVDITDGERYLSFSFDPHGNYEKIEGFVIEGRQVYVREITPAEIMLEGVEITFEDILVMQAETGFSMAPLILDDYAGEYVYNETFLQEIGVEHVKVIRSDGFFRDCSRYYDADAETLYISISMELDRSLGQSKLSFLKSIWQELRKEYWSKKDFSEYEAALLARSDTLMISHTSEALTDIAIKQVIEIMDEETLRDLASMDDDAEDVANVFLRAMDRVSFDPDSGNLHFFPFSPEQVSGYAEIEIRFRNAVRKFISGIDSERAKAKDFPEPAKVEKRIVGPQTPEERIKHDTKYNNAKSIADSLGIDIGDEIDGNVIRRQIGNIIAAYSLETDPIEEGMVRLFRGEPEHIVGVIFGVNRRWFAEMEEAIYYMYYNSQAGSLAYVDIPLTSLESFRVSNIPLKPGGKGTEHNPAAFSRRPDHEFYLLPELIQEFGIRDPIEQIKKINTSNLVDAIKNKTITNNPQVQRGWVRRRVFGIENFGDAWTSSHLVIGDLHANLEALERIVTDSDFMNDDEKVMVTMGDEIDKGLLPFETVKRLRELQQQKGKDKLVRLFGNHELMFLAGMMGQDGQMYSWLDSINRDGSIHVYLPDDIIREIRQSFQMVDSGDPFEASRGETRFRTEVYPKIRNIPELEQLAENYLSDIIDGNVRAVYTDGEVLFSHAGIHPRALEGVDYRSPEDIAKHFNNILVRSAENRDFSDPIYEFRGLDDTYSIFWLHNRDNLGEEDLPFYQIFGHVRNPGKLTHTANNRHINTDSEIFSGNVGYLDISPGGMVSANMLDTVNIDAGGERIRILSERSSPANQSARERVLFAPAGETAGSDASSAIGKVTDSAGEVVSGFDVIERSQNVVFRYRDVNDTKSIQINKSSNQNISPEILRKAAQAVLDNNNYLTESERERLNNLLEGLQGVSRLVVLQDHPDIKGGVNVDGDVRTVFLSESIKDNPLAIIHELGESADILENMEDKGITRHTGMRGTGRKIRNLQYSSPELSNTRMPENSEQLDQFLDKIDSVAERYFLIGRPLTESERSLARYNFAMRDTPGFRESFRDFGVQALFFGIQDRIDPYGNEAFSSSIADMKENLRRGHMNIVVARVSPLARSAHERWARQTGRDFRKVGVDTLFMGYSDFDDLTASLRRAVQEARKNPDKDPGVFVNCLVNDISGMEKPIDRITDQDSDYDRMRKWIAENLSPEDAAMIILSPDASAIGLTSSQLDDFNTDVVKLVSFASIALNDRRLSLSPGMTPENLADIRRQLLFHLRSCGLFYDFERLENEYFNESEGGLNAENLDRFMRAIHRGLVITQITRINFQSIVEYNQAMEAVYRSL